MLPSVRFSQQKWKFNSNPIKLIGLMRLFITRHFFVWMLATHIYLLKSNLDRTRKIRDLIEEKWCIKYHRAKGRWKKKCKLHVLEALTDFYGAGKLRDQVSIKRLHFPDLSSKVEQNLHYKYLCCICAFSIWLH